MTFLLRIWVGLFTAGALIFLLAGNRLLQTINHLSENVLHLNWPPIPLATEKFWLVLTTSLMVTLVALCYQAQRNLRQNYPIISFVLVSKLVSTIVFTVFFVTDGPILAYLIGGAFCDGPIFVITAILYRRLLAAYQGTPFILPTAPPNRS